MTSSEESLSSSRYGERTPLRSLNNDIQRFSTPSSRIRSKSQHSNDAVKMKMGDVLLCDSDPRFHSSPDTKTIQTSFSHVDITQTASGLEDVTFRSFNCSGGELEIPEYSVCIEEGVSFHDDAAARTNETEDTVVSHSIMEQSCSDHEEHPYSNPKVQETVSVGIGEESVCEIPDNTFSFCDVESKQDVQGLQGCHGNCSGEKNITWKSFTCDGGEVEVSDTTKLQEDTIPLPVMDFSSSSQLNLTHSANSSATCAQLSQSEHVDHPYFNQEESEEPSNRLNDITLKSFNCTGGEMQISESTEDADKMVSLPLTHVSCESCDHCVDLSMLVGDEGLQKSDDHSDHPYCNIENNSSPSHGNISTNKESRRSETLEVEQISVLVPEGEVTTCEIVAECSIIPPGGEEESSNGSQVLEKPNSPRDQKGDSQSFDYTVSTSLTQDHNESATSHLKITEVVVQTSDGESLKVLDSDTVKQQEQEMTGDTEHPEADLAPSRIKKSSCCNSASSTESPVYQEVQQSLDYVSLVGSSVGISEPSKGLDSALGLSPNYPVPCNFAEKPAEGLPDVLKVLSECASVVSALQLGLSPVVKRASLSLMKAHGNSSRPSWHPAFIPQSADVVKRASLPLLESHGNSPQSGFLADDSALEDEKSYVTSVDAEVVGLLAEHLESPMPRPLFNSTAIGYKSQPMSSATQDVGLAKNPCAAPQPEGVPLISEGQLQQQLRQMAEFLLLASGQMGASAPPPAVFRAPPTDSHSVCVGTSPVKMTERSLNTSGIFVRRREFSVADSCTATDPLVWNFPPGSLENLPREELEQRLMSSMIMVEALVQQLAAARAHGRLSSGPAPSDLREKLVQTDHTELSQTTMYRELYVEALGRISELELDGSSLQNLIPSMRDARATVASLISDTDAALFNLDDWRDVVREDHHVLSSHYQHMMSLLEKSKDMQTRMMQKVRDVLLEREDMKTQMEEAFTAKEAAFNTMDQLKIHCASEISALEKSVGSQQQLLAALNHTYPEQVALNTACNETLNSASDLLSQTMEEHISLMKELCAVRNLLQKTASVLLQLNQKTAAALRERDEHCSARDQAIKERDQIEEELNETSLNLQTAEQQIGDLTLQVTILSSEMGVLRQKLTEKEEETSQLGRQVTELSATVSSTLASYTFLEQALAAETTKLQQSWKDIQQANERANQLKVSLEESEQCVCEMSQALAQKEEQAHQLQTLSQSQSVQIQQLQDVCTQLSGMQEMNEFLQMENELAREQVAESERLLRTNLQALRERNIECEDLKEEVCKLQIENRNLHEELETTRSSADAVRIESEEKMAQAVTEITLLHHTLRGLTDELHVALSDQEQDPQSDKEPELLCVEHRNPSCSFVDSIMVALTAEKEDDVETDTPFSSDVPELQSETLFSETSAFTRVAAQTPKMNVKEKKEEEEEEEQSSVCKLLSGLGKTVAELVSSIKLVQQHKDAQMQELHRTTCGLQVELQAASNQHQAEVLELKHQLSCLNNLVERGNQALQQKTQDEKTLTKLVADVQEAQEILNKHKTDNSELKKEVVELRRALQQSRVESQVLRDELRKTGDQSADSVHHIEEKIHLIKEMERLKITLQEAEQARVKLLERANRHKIIHQTNMQKIENELQILNNMINKVRETLLSLPEVVKSCERLQQLLEFIG